MNFQDSDLALHIEAYREAGNKLVEGSLRDQSFPHEIALPISSLYRLYLELSLKQLIFLGNQLLTIPLKWNDEDSKIVGFPPTHNLGYLLSNCRDILTQLEPVHKPLADLHFDLLETCIHDYFSKESIHELIRDYFSIDVKEDSFRYPIDKKGNPFLPDRYSVNIYELRESISRVDTLFFDEALLAIVDILQKTVRPVT